MIVVVAKQLSDHAHAMKDIRAVCEQWCRAMPAVAASVLERRCGSIDLLLEEDGYDLHTQDCNGVMND